MKHRSQNPQQDKKQGQQTFPRHHRQGQPDQQQNPQSRGKPGRQEDNHNSARGESSPVNDDEEE